MNDAAVNITGFIDKKYKIETILDQMNDAAVNITGFIDKKYKIETIKLSNNTKMVFYSLTLCQ